MSEHLLSFIGTLESGQEAVQKVCEEAALTVNYNKQTSYWHFMIFVLGDYPFQNTGERINNKQVIGTICERKNNWEKCSKSVLQPQSIQITTKKTSL